jgi:phage tail sheath protein FI
VNVRRFFILIERTIHNDTQRAVFQPNEPLCSSNVSNGSMPRNDIDNGCSICAVGIARVRLVKFVIFRIGQRRRRRRRWSGEGIGGFGDNQTAESAQAGMYHRGCVPSCA